MEFRKITAIYFSPVGHTEAVTTFLSSELAALCREAQRAPGASVSHLDFTLPAARRATYEFSSDDLVVFGTPTYAGRVPNKILPFLRQLFRGSQTPAIAVTTFGNRNFDSSLTELTQELSALGFCVFAAAGVVCEHVFSHRLATGRPDASDREELSLFATSAFQKLMRAPDHFALTVPRIRDNALVAPYYTPLGTDGQPAHFLKAKPVTQIDLCENCHLCARLCPMGCIDPDDVSQMLGTCIKCHSCVRRCPHHAKGFSDEAFLSHVTMLEQNFLRPAASEFYL